MKKRILSALIMFAMVATTLLYGCFLSEDESTVFATNKYDEQIDDLKDELEDIESLKVDSKNQAVVLSKEITALQTEISDLNAQITETNKKITETEKQLKAKQEEQAGRSEDLNSRLVVMYKNGSIGFLDVLLGSNGLSELVSNIKMIQKIYRNDQDVLAQLEEEEANLKDIKAELAEEKSELASQKSSLASKQSTLSTKKTALQKQIAAYEAEEKSLQEEITRLTDLSKAYVGGDFIFPLPEKYRTKSRITSKYGYRMHPIYKVNMLHSGTDFGCPKGTPIYAAQTGKVILSKYYGNYGNCIMIDHGGGIVTLYAHCSKLCVSVGKSVKVGDKIAEVGATGAATGNHLHFEVRINNKPVDSLQYFPDLYN